MHFYGEILKYFIDNWKHLFILLNIHTNGIVALDIINPPTPQLLYNTNEESSFHEKYTILNELGKGTHSTVFLCKNDQGELVAVKKYAISDQQIIELLEKNGSSVDAYITQLAQKELEIGQLVDHPNIVKVKEVIFENSTAYVIMDYVEGKPLDYSESYSVETRIVFMQQLLSAIEHLLLRNIIIDDLWSGNILISDDSYLTLIDLGGNEIINRDAEMPVEHYLKMIESVIKSIGGDVAEEALRNYRQFFSAALREEIISPAHIGAFVYWIEALQRELSTTPVNLNNTFYGESSE